MNFEIKQKLIESQNVMYISKSLPHEKLHEVGIYFDKVMQYIISNGGEITGSFLRYVDNSTMQLMNLEICIAVKSFLPENDEIKSKTIEETNEIMACGILKGSYSGLGEFYKQMDDFIRAQGKTYADGAMWEIYLNNPANVPEDELLTEILIPVK